MASFKTYYVTNWLGSRIVNSCDYAPTETPRQKVTSTDIRPMPVIQPSTSTTTRRVTV